LRAAPPPDALEVQLELGVGDLVRFLVPPLRVPRGTTSRSREAAGTRVFPVSFGRVFSRVRRRQGCVEALGVAFGAVAVGATVLWP